ncbi:Hypothetical predicted protein [Mytilus galloprovincialis]|uniref:Uncharacterized protein n=1 Tax=Mytilus galloprovincialis TaxID=29158 RepID=A0A8B6FA87_MYTGA|nr:Hypothetical predicted protein [Mytilus galloprovincialis]
MQELLKQKRLSNIQGYLNYTADIYRLAARNVWYSVLLYDKEYRQKQADELFEWGIYRQDLRDFQLVSKRDNPTFRAFSEASVGASKGRGRNSRPGIDERRKDGASRPLDLEITVGRLKTKGWAESTSGTYRTHLKTYVQFCEEYEFKAVPCDKKNS